MTDSSFQKSKIQWVLEIISVLTTFLLTFGAGVWYTRQGLLEFFIAGGLGVLLTVIGTYWSQSVGTHKNQILDASMFGVFAGATFFVGYFVIVIVTALVFIMIGMTLSG